MTYEKFQGEIETLKKFYEYYCINKHSDLKYHNIILDYKNNSTPLDLLLCNCCKENIMYSFEKLQNCPHEIKPRCRSCPSPCYEKVQWKNTAKVMKYSAINLGLSKMKQKVKKFFTN